MRYANARYQAMQRDMAYRIYISDCARILTENTAMLTWQGSPYFASRFIDIINNDPQQTPKEGEAKRAILLKLEE